ncbi:Crp/Fnr family transcriptional regulator [Pediococcus siamensis]|uniref:Crp/Fnr family transcriptional regulator n=1 Tax=Pediococcus siamensis TaxID=381829 RepID=UPI0039A2D1DB
MMINPEEKQKYIDYLAQTREGQVLTSDERKKALAYLKFKKVGKGQRLIEQYEEGRYVFFVKEGFFKASVFDKDEETAYVTFYCPDRVFPVKEILSGNYHYGYTVIALTEAVVAYLPITLFVNLAQNNAAFMMAICKRVANVLNDAEVFGQTVNISSAVRRVTKKLEALRCNYAIADEKGSRLPFPLPIKEFAALVGTSRETTGKIIRDLVQEKKLGYEKKHFIFPKAP